MNTKFSIAILIATILAGCQKPTEVQLSDDQSRLEIEAISDADTSLDGTAVDTTALLPRDHRDYVGFATVSSVRSDWGTGVRQSVHARVVVVNKSNRIPFHDRGVFFGRLLGTVRINGEFMIPRLRIQGNLDSGVEYVRDILNHLPRRVYTFTADSLASPLTIESPENLTVTSPVGGQRINRGSDLELRWSGQGKISLIISKVTIEQGETRVVPVLNINARQADGRVVLSRRVLSLLPRGDYVFSFVASNRAEYQTLRYQGKVLMQASSIHNVRVDLI
ncbi:MAG: hypothetical protein KF749_04485 [Bacteroidetes bacterium]|nr:hypothetical protein [Bacteroidota bacterium]MCW5895475.1 hypothetical protein [Bacteroidota bacterium]